MTASLARFLMPVAIGILACGATLASCGTTARAQEAADAGTFQGAGLAAPDGRVADAAAGSAQTEATLAALLDHPLARFASAAALVASLVAGARRKFKRLREDTDAAKVKTMVLSLFFGVLLGVVGLAPEVPAFVGMLGRCMGGATAAMFASFGVSLAGRSSNAHAQARVRKAVNPS